VRTPPPTALLRAAVVAALALGAGVGAGCNGAPVVSERLPAPGVAASVRHYSGPALAGGVPCEVEPAEPESALEVLVAFVALERVPPGALDALGSRARLIATDGGEDGGPLLAVPRLLLGARAGPVESVRAFLETLERGDLGRAARFADLRGALPLDTTATFELVRERGRAPEAARGPGLPGLGSSRDRLAVALHRTRVGAVDRLDLALEAGKAASGGGAEVAVLERLSIAGSLAFAAIVPSIFDGEAAGAIAIAVLVRPPPGPLDIGFGAHRTAYVGCLADLARSDFEARLRRGLRPAPAPAAPGVAPDLLVAREALVEPARFRTALLALGRTTGARGAEDLALGADDACVERTAAAVAAALRSFPGNASSPDLGWIVERAALTAVGPYLAVKESDPALFAIALRRAGAVGRLPATLAAVLDAATDLDDLERRLEAANVDVLDDPYPLLRVQAHEWLSARGLGPAGYDPLAPGAERRAALEAHERAAVAGGGGDGGAVR